MKYILDCYAKDAENVSEHAHELFEQIHCATIKDVEKTLIRNRARFSCVVVNNANNIAIDTLYSFSYSDLLKCVSYLQVNEINAELLELESFLYLCSRNTQAHKIVKRKINKQVKRKHELLTKIYA